MKITNNKSGFEIKDREDSIKLEPYSKAYNVNGKRGYSIKGKKGFQRKVDSEPMSEMITFTVSKKTKMKLKLFCVENDITQSELLREILTTILENR